MSVNCHRRSLIAQPFVCLVCILVYIAGCQTIQVTPWELLRAPDNLRLSDFCMINDRMFLVFSNSHQIYGLESDSVVPLWGEYGVGKLKFRSPNKIKSYNNKVVICDRENIQLQIVDMSGTFVGAIPSRRTMDFHYQTTTLDKFSLTDFFAANQYLGILTREEQEDGTARDKLSLFEHNVSEPTRFDRDFQEYGQLAFDQATNTIFVEDYQTIVSLGTKGDAVGSIGRWTEPDIQFSKIEDMACLDGRLYVLDSRSAPTFGYEESAIIYVLDRSLARVDSIVFGKSYRIPRALDFVDDGRIILVVSSEANALWRIENPFTQDSILSIPKRGGPN